MKPVSTQEKKYWRKCKLWDQDPHCHWCGVVMISPQAWRAVNGGNCKVKHMPDNLATLDHLNTRIDGRVQSRDGIPTTVLACWKCNTDRGKEQVALLSLEEQRRRSNAYPLDHAIADDRAR